MSLSDEYLELQKCNKKLSKLTNVNQKALNQLTEGQQKAKLLRDEKKDIYLGYHSIEKLIESLEHQKYEAIQLTYRQVSKFFTQVFKKLVPEGQAFLDMMYGNNNGSESSQQSQESESSGGISATGLTIKLFNFEFFSLILFKIQTQIDFWHSVESITFLASKLGSPSRERQLLKKCISCRAVRNR